jgi:hypothetical protein
MNELRPIHLLRVNGSNIHGSMTFDATFRARVVVLLGGNEAGKSTLLGLPRLALEGPSGSTWPVLGTSPAYDWMCRLQFVNSPDVDLERGAIIQSEVDRRVTGGKHVAALNARGGTLASVNAQIEATLGSASVWSLEAFLSQTPTKRLAWLEENALQGAGWSLDQVEAEVRASLERVRVALDVAIEPGKPLRRTTDKDGRALLGRLITLLRDRWLDADRRTKSVQKAIENDERAVANFAGGRPPGTVPGLRAQVVDIDTKLAELNRAKGASEAGRAEFVRATDEVNRLVRELENTHNVDTDKVVADRAREETNARARLEALQRQDPSDVGVGRRAELERLESTAKQIEGLRDAANVDLAKVRAILELEPLLRPLLFGVDDRVAALVADGFEERASFLRDSHDSIVKTLNAGGAAIERASDVLAVANVDLEAVRVQLSAARRQIERADNEKAAWTRNVDGARNELRNATTAAKAAVDAKLSTEQRRAQLAEQLDAARNVLTGLDTTDTSAIDLQIAGLDAEKVQLTKNADRLTDYTGLVATLASRREEHRAALDERTRTRIAGEALQEVFGRMLAALVGPLREAMNEVIGPVLDGEVLLDTTDGLSISLLRPGGGTGEVPRPDVVVPLETMSRSTRAVVFVALRYAITTQLGGWRALLLDDLENLNADLESPADSRRDRLVLTLSELAFAGKIDNAILACVDDGWRPILDRDVQVIEMGGPRV